MVTVVPEKVENSEENEFTPVATYTFPVPNLLPSVDDDPTDPEPIRVTGAFMESSPVAAGTVRTVVRFISHCQNAVDVLMDNFEVLRGRAFTEEDKKEIDEAISEFRSAGNVLLNKFLPEGDYVSTTYRARNANA